MADAGDFMAEALREAELAAAAGEVPVGAVVVRDGVVIGRGQNRMRADADPIAHAEMVAIREALGVAGGVLSDADLYVTLEPCTMCAGAIAHARLRRVYFGAEDTKGGAVSNGVRFFAQKTCLHRPEVIGGLRETEAGEMLRAFFAARR